MVTYLQQVARHYAADPERLSRTVFVLPNRRSAMRLRHDLSEAAPGCHPRCVAVDAFFRTLHGRETAPRTRLVLTLYGCYSALVPDPEPLDEFLHWGGVILSDFNDVDKSLADPEAVFVSVAKYRSAGKAAGGRGRDAVRAFVDHLGTGRDGDMRSRFLRTWEVLGPLYAAFNAACAGRGLAYEGMAYRSLAESVLKGFDLAALAADRFHGRDRFVFAGLNALNECEKTVLRALRDASAAEFSWDFSSEEIRDPRNLASAYIGKNLAEFPQAFTPDPGGLGRPAVNVVSVPSSSGEAKLAPAILSRCDGDLSGTAFVLPDEALLAPLLTALPDGTGTVNVTMGFPMERSSVHALLRSAGALQLGAREADGEVLFHHGAFADVASCGAFRSALTDEGRAFVAGIRKEARQWIPAAAFAGCPDGTVRAVFSPVLHDGRPLDNTLSDAGQNHALAAWLVEAVGAVASRLGDDTDGAVEAVFAERAASVITSLDDERVPVRPAAWLRLLDGFLRGESIPFEGDSLGGLQVMGTLETRALDFRNVAVLGANEDLFPRRGADASLIPAALRRAFGLPTAEDREAVWAYYFYRLIQRAENVWLVYDSRTEGLLSGEESRYVKQLEYHFGFRLRRFSAVAPVEAARTEEAVTKTAEDVEALRRHHLSASSVQSYLACPARFYYQAVKGLREDDGVKESIDAAMLGTVFHGVMEALYKGRRTVTQEDLRGMLNNEQAIRTLIREGICGEMRSTGVEGRNLVVEEVVLEYVRGALRHDLELLRVSGSRGFRILGLERKVESAIDGFPFVGYIDRIDTYRDGEVRIVDYKTGHVEDDDILITAKNAKAVSEKLFAENSPSRPKIALQLYLYDRFAREAGIVGKDETTVNGIYSTARLLTRPLPDVAECPEFSAIAGEGLSKVLAEIADTSVPWKRTCDRRTCTTCPFRSICGR